MFEILGEFLDTTARVALRRWFPPWARSAIASALMLVAAGLYKKLPGWAHALVYGHWLAMLLTVTLGLVGWLVFKIPFARGARGRVFPWVWSGLGLASVAGFLAFLQFSRGEPIGFSEWYAVGFWAVAQFWYLRESRSAADATKLSEALLLRTLYGVPVFTVTCCLALGEGPMAEAGRALQLAIFHAVMMWVNHRIHVRHEG